MFSLVNVLPLRGFFFSLVLSNNKVCVLSMSALVKKKYFHDM